MNLAPGEFLVGTFTISSTLGLVDERFTVIIRTQMLTRPPPSLIVIRAQKLAPRGSGGFADPAVRVYKGGKVEHMYESRRTCQLPFMIVCRPVSDVHATSLRSWWFLGQSLRLILWILCGMRMWSCTWCLKLALPLCRCCVCNSPQKLCLLCLVMC